MGIDVKNQAAYFKTWSAKKRAEVLEKYGGKCECCGVDEPRFLTIDHIKNDGALHRQALKTAWIYSRLVRSNCPAGFRILCYNCNCGRQRNKGICPHVDKNVAIN